ncbi:MAG: hypothetical protein ACRELF_01020 [Gemmataceae bacterium]
MRDEGCRRACYVSYAKVFLGKKLSRAFLAAIGQKSRIFSDLGRLCLLLHYLCFAGQLLDSLTLRRKLSRAFLTVIGQKSRTFPDIGSSFSRRLSLRMARAKAGADSSD